MLKYAFDKIKGLFRKNGKQNSIEVGTMENGNIYQDSVVKIENPAIVQKSLAERHLHGVLATLYRSISDTSPR